MHIFDCSKCGKAVHLEGKKLDGFLDITVNCCWLPWCQDCADKYRATQPEPEPEPPRLTFAEWDKQIAQQHVRQ